MLLFQTSTRKPKGAEGTCCWIRVLSNRVSRHSG